MTELLRQKQESSKAYFLWLGSELPDVAKVSILSAAEAGFCTIVFVDRPQAISHPQIVCIDYREVELAWEPIDIRLKGEKKPCYAAYSDLFRFKLLAEHDGWWFDCDTLILRRETEYATLMEPNSLILGREDQRVVNGAVIGSLGKLESQRLYDAAVPFFPILDRWGVVGPNLITRMIESDEIKAKVVEPHVFYPVHHNEVTRLYEPDECGRLLAQESEWYCVSLWGEILSRSGLSYLEPPPGCYLAHALKRRPILGRISGDGAAMATFLKHNLQRLDELDSGRMALNTLHRKAKAWLSKWGI